MKLRNRKHVRDTLLDTSTVLERIDRVAALTNTLTIELAGLYSASDGLSLRKRKAVAEVVDHSTRGLRGANDDWFDRLLHPRPASYAAERREKLQRVFSARRELENLKT